MGWTGGSKTQILKSSEINKEYESQRIRGDIYKEKNHQKFISHCRGKGSTRSCSKSLPEAGSPMTGSSRIPPPPAQQFCRLTQRASHPLQAWAALVYRPNPDSSIAYHTPAARIKESLYKALVQKDHSQKTHNYMLQPPPHHPATKPPLRAHLDQLITLLALWDTLKEGVVLLLSGCLL